jgi:hypothetical protein
MTTYSPSAASRPPLQTRTTGTALQHGFASSQGVIRDRERLKAGARKPRHLNVSVSTGSGQSAAGGWPRRSQGILRAPGYTRRSATARVSLRFL